MEQKSYSHIQLFVFVGFLLSLALMTSFILFDGYAHARSPGIELGIAVPNTHTQALGNQIIPDLTKPTSTLIPQFDLASDDSFQRYLDNDHPFTNLNYVPADLAPIDSNFTANDARKFKLRQEAGDMFADMAWHFRHDFSGDRLAIVSAYRSKGFQDSMLSAGCSPAICADAGTSEHQAGLALDLTVVTRGGRTMSLTKPNKYTDRLHEYAYQRGFHNTYQRGIAIDGHVVEGWHRRYLGTGLAALLFQNNQTIAEYYKSLQN